MSKQSLSDAIDMLADEIENGHLLAATGGGLLLEAATDDIRKLKAEVERLRGLLRRYMACDGAHGRYNAIELSDTRQEVRELLRLEGDK